MKDILKYTFDLLGKSFATRNIEQRLKEYKEYDYRFAKYICKLVYKLQPKNYDQAVQDFIDLSTEYLMLQAACLWMQEQWSLRR